MSAMPAAPSGTLIELRNGFHSPPFPCHPPIAGPPFTFLQFESMKSVMMRASNQLLSPRTTSSHFASPLTTTPAVPFGKKTGVYTIDIRPAPLKGTSKSRFPSGTMLCADAAAPSTATAAAIHLLNFIVSFSAFQFMAILT